MDNNIVIAGLLARRAEIQKAINDIEREARKQIRAHRLALGNIDGAIELFEPGVVAASAEPQGAARRSIRSGHRDASDRRRW